jgi:hypothetical protein
VNISFLKIPQTKSFTPLISPLNLGLSLSPSVIRKGRLIILAYNAPIVDNFKHLKRTDDFSKREREESE